MRENFLARDVLERKIGSVDLTGFASAWIAKEENAMRLANGIGRYIPAMIEKLEERDVHTLVRKRDDGAAERPECGAPARRRPEAVRGGRAS